MIMTNVSYEGITSSMNLEIFRKNNLYQIRMHIKSKQKNLIQILR